MDRFITWCLPAECISVICDKDKPDDKGCHGAPDWVIEIVSPGSRRMDYDTKLFKYRIAGVREYWIVDSMKERIVVWHFEPDSEHPELEVMELYTFNDSVKAGIYEDLCINFSQVTL